MPKDDDLNKAAVEFLDLFGGSNDFTFFIKGFKSIYKNKVVRSDILEFGAPHYSRMTLEILRKVERTKDSNEKAKLLGQAYGYGLLVVESISDPDYWKSRTGDLKTKQISEILKTFKEIGSLLKFLEKGVGSDFLKRKISRIAKERGANLPRDVQILISQIAALVKK